MVLLANKFYEEETDQKKKQIKIIFCIRPDKYTGNLHSFHKTLGNQISYRC